MQILTECLSESPVEECTALLLRITRYEHAFEQWSPTELDHAIPLMWSYSDAAPHTLYPGVDYRVNVLWFVDRGHIGLETWPQTVAAQYVFSKGELWQFDIRLTAKGAKPVDVSLRVAFSKERNGAWYEELAVEQL